VESVMGRYFPASTEWHNDHASHATTRAQLQIHGAPSQAAASCERETGTRRRVSEEKFSRMLRMRYRCLRGGSAAQQSIGQHTRKIQNEIEFNMLAGRAMIVVKGSSFF
jgi:hypothetical protein